MPRGKSHVLRHAGLFSPLQAGDLVWAYLRHSPGEDQDIRSQREVVERFCLARQYTVLQWWIDEAVSGGSVAGRDQFEAMVATSRQTPPPVAGIVVRDLGRLSRDDLESQFYMADLRLRGFRIVSAFDDIPAGEFAPIFESFIRWKNARFLRDLQANVHSGLDTSVAARYVIDGQERTGFSGGGFPPVGYEARRAQVGTKKSGKPMVAVYWVKTPDLDLRARVQRAWDMAVEAARAGQAVTLSRVHEETKILGAVTSYYDFFEHITYAGVRKVGNRLVEAAHEAYVGRADWDMVQQASRRARPARLRRDNHHAHAPFELSGRVFCGYCGSPVWREPQGGNLPGYFRLRCSRRRQSGDCGLMQASYAPLLATLIAKLQEAFSPEAFEAVIAGMNRQRSGSRERVEEQRQQFAREVASLDKTITRLVDAVEAGRGGAVADRLAQREAERTDVEAKLARLAAQERAWKPLRARRPAIEAVTRMLLEALGSSDPETLRETLGVLVRRVTLYNDHAEIECTWDPVALLLFPDSRLAPHRGLVGYPQGDAHRTPDCRLVVPIVHRYRNHRPA